MGAAVVHSNLADSATISASSSLLLAQPSRVQNEHVGRKWRSQLPTSHLVLDLGSAQSIDVVAMIGLTASTIRCRVSATDDTGAAGELYDSTEVAVDQDFLQAIFLLSAPATGRYVRIDLTHATLTYTEVGRAVIGLKSAFTVNYAYGWGRTYVDPSIRTTTRGGLTQIRSQSTYRMVELPFDWIEEADRLGFIETIDRVNGLKSDVLMLLDTDSGNLPRDTIWGLISDASPVNQPYFDVYSKQYRIEERR
ncbi:MAG: hypothetical protein Rhirs2KO_18560 [Rhizobiaceae bacterium]